LKVRKKKGLKVLSKSRLLRSNKNVNVKGLYFLPKNADKSTLQQLSENISVSDI
jgi:hypothetical protein